MTPAYHANIYIAEPHCPTILQGLHGQVTIENKLPLVHYLSCCILTTRR